MQLANVNKNQKSKRLPTVVLQKQFEILKYRLHFTFVVMIIDRAITKLTSYETFSAFVAGNYYHRCHTFTRCQSCTIRVLKS